MEVMIGVDPHKASHHAFAVDDGEVELAQVSVRASREQVDRLLTWAEPFPRRMWAVEGSDGMGYLLSQQLVAAGERVVDVPATLAARTRVLGSGRSNKTDPNDARSVALTALRHADLREVRPVGHAEVLRLLAKRNTDIGDRRTQVVSRMHSLLVELAPGGIAKEINASDVDTFLEQLTPATPVEQTRYDLAVELLAEIRALDAQLKASHKRIRAAIAASSTTVTDLFGIGPIIAAMLIGYTGDVGRFRDRDHYAAYNGTAPVEFSSGGRTVHRASTRGNRQLNHALHMAAICQLRQPHSAGRA
ncbi:MAG: IS110 family transposase [Ilumatobacter sp.]|uniref:IS110 family transposase n=1 Tax=Ilumatobacter sp. TaxID=1967498 RepID=UPI002613A0C7|nr:IS110 family transposase [Ilumatobacter sp.]MDJ0771421.1 IS110 family transposase [Ilumatobacter sp.]